jgi:RNA polymerase sigma factor (TIGR02999 family)
VEDALFAAIYEDLHRIARRLMRGEQEGHTLQATALVNEAYLRLEQSDVDFGDRTHFLSVAARVMRRFLVDHARGRGRMKRGGAGERITLDPAALRARDAPLDILAFDRALSRLEGLDARKAEFVQLRHLAGLGLDEIAGMAGVSTRTVKRELQFARAFLRSEIEAQAP